MGGSNYIQRLDGSFFTSTALDLNVLLCRLFVLERWKEGWWMKIKSGYCAGLAWQTLSNVKLVLLCQIFCSHHSARPLCRPTSWFRINRNIQRRFSRHKPNSIKSGCTGLLPPHPARLVDNIVTIVKSNKESLMWDDEMRLSVCIDFAGLLAILQRVFHVPRLKTDKPQAPRKTHLRTTTATYSVKLIIYSLKLSL